MFETETVIIGGGLCGLALSNHLSRAGRSNQVLEARGRVGGRIYGIVPDQTHSGTLDAGPAWIWPHNRLMLQLLEQLQIEHFPQYATGRLVFEDPSGGVRRDLDFAPMAGSLRVSGGLKRVVDALHANLQPETVRLNHTVMRAACTDQGVVVSGQSGTDLFEITAKQVVVALPPRIIARDIQFNPDLPPELSRAFTNTPTWMAGHAKFVAAYPSAFWRDQGLSGDAISHKGPMAEIHDASPDSGDTGALFGFLAVPANHRRELGDSALITECIAQLVNLFGSDADSPSGAWLQDWAADPHTATQADWDPPASHPEYGGLAAFSASSDKRILFAGTELAPHDGGFLEGAVASAKHIANRILSS